MARQTSNKLGIEFGANELRIFELRTNGTERSVGCVGAVPLEPGYLENGVIAHPEAVGERLRLFLDRQRVSSSDVVACFPTDNCTVRVLTIPRAPDSELRALINGEVEHFGLVRQGGVYDHYRLNTTPKEGVGTSVLFMATESPVMASIDRTLESAGLRLLVLEPTHIALLRSAHSLAAKTDDSLFLTISEHRSDVSLMSDGKLAFYRSFEIGANELVKVQASASMFPDVDDRMTMAARCLNLEAASTLAIEIRRSIDYFGREFPEAPDLSRIVVASNTPACHPLGDWLQEVTKLETEAVRLTGDAVPGSGEFSMEDGIRFLTVYGLAIRDVQQQNKDLPRLDLSLHEQMVSALEQSDRRLRIGAYLCTGLFAATLIGTALGYFKSKNSESNLATAQRDLKLSQNLEQQRLSEMQTRTDRLAALQVKGIAVNRIILGVGRSLPTTAGLSELRLATGRVDLTGEANSEETIVKLTRNLQQNSFVTNVSLSTFERIYGMSGSRGIKFQMAVATTLTPAMTPALLPTEATK